MALQGGCLLGRSKVAAWHAAGAGFQVDVALNSRRSAQFSVFLTYKPAKFCCRLVLLFTQVSVSNNLKQRENV